MFTNVTVQSIVPITAFEIHRYSTLNWKLVRTSTQLLILNSSSTQFVVYYKLIEHFEYQCLNILKIRFQFPYLSYSILLGWRKFTDVNENNYRNSGPVRKQLVINVEDVIEDDTGSKYIITLTNPFEDMDEEQPPKNSFLK